MKTDYIHIDPLATPIRNGDIKSFQLLYQKMSGRILQYAYSFVLTHEEAEEIMHDVFLRVWDKRTTLASDKSLSGFIYTITKNLALDRVRKYTLESEKLKEYFHGKPIDHQKSGEQKYLYDELNSTIEHIVQDMPSRRKKVFHMSRNQGMSNVEISEYLNISTTAVEKHIRLALDTIREELSKRDLSIFILIILMSFLL